jgi:DNA adenine methylase
MTKVPTLVKWVGGKRQLLSQLESLFPKEFNNYFEPFAGGGAVAFYLIKTRNPKKVFISDINEELIGTYTLVKKNPTELIKLLEQYKENHNKENYYNVRAKDPKLLSELERAARFIYLNKTCFNGLYRVNLKGGFNVPMGKYKNPAISKSEDLNEISCLLENVQIELKQFHEAVETAIEGDFVYFDPPYYPLNRTSNFTSYTKDSFLEKEQIKLAETFKKLDNRGVKVMLSNSDTEFIKELYKDYNQTFVQARRNINSKADKRGKIKELVVTNY